MNITFCPVPLEQQPLQEFLSMKRSWFFKWPIEPKNSLRRKLIISWLLFLPFVLIIFNGSTTLSSNHLELMITSYFASVTLPFLLLLRQYISWKYILNRLMSDSVVYEESGWYDGQIWLKPDSYRDKESLIGQLEVLPLVTILSRYLRVSIVILTQGILGSTTGIFASIQ